jgi:hypothetical protein
MGVYKTAGGWRTQQEKMKIVEGREKKLKSQVAK